MSSKNFLAITDTVDNNDRPQESPVWTSSSLSSADCISTWHTLNSFLPIFKLLGPSKFVLDQNTYYIHGSLDDNDLKVLQDHRSMVAEFVFTDSDVENVEPNISPAAFLHIVQLLKSAFLPSLLRLRILRANTHFAYLHLLHTPSLKTLEAANILDHQHPTFFAFVTTLVHKAPLLEDIILGPGQFPSKTLQAVFKFTHLRQLELKNVALKINSTFFQDVGTLPNLESFILDARSCKYISPIPEDSTEHAEVGNTPSQEQFQTPPAKYTEFGSPPSTPIPHIDGDGTFELIHGRPGSPCTVHEYHHEKLVYGKQSPKLSSDIDVDGSSGVVYPCLSHLSGPIYEDDDKGVDSPSQPICIPIPGDTISSTLAAGGFYQLKKLHFVGGLPLIQDMIPYISSRILEDISITAIRPSHQDLKQEDENKRQIDVEERKRRIAEETEQMIAAIEPARKKSERKRIKIYILEEMERRMQEAELSFTEEAQKAVFDLPTASYINVIRKVSSRWSADLKAVKFDQLDQSSQPLSISPTLPEQVYETLFCHRNLEMLELGGWKLDSVENFLFSLKLFAPKNLKRLHLPIDNSAVSLSGLRNIAEACPMLTSLRCCIDTLLPIPEHPIPARTVLCHGLQTLFVANDSSSSSWDFKQLLLVAHHLYLVFPHLKTISCVEGPNAEQWVHIHELISTFQTIRAARVHRFSKR